MYHIDTNSAQTNEHNQVLYFSHFPFRSLAKVTNVPCADGIALGRTSTLSARGPLSAGSIEWVKPGLYIPV